MSDDRVDELKLMLFDLEAAAAHAHEAEDRAAKARSTLRAIRGRIAMAYSELAEGGEPLYVDGYVIHGCGDIIQKARAL